MVFLLKKNTNTIILVVAFVIALIYFYKFYSFEINSSAQSEAFCGNGCGQIGYPYKEEEPEYRPQYENFNSCYRRKQIYLNSCDPEQPSSHADVNLERRFGKLYINIIANLPYAKGGVFNTIWGSYESYLLDTRNNKSINLGSLVHDGSRHYKLATELLGEYSNYDTIAIYRQTEDYAPKKIVEGSIRCQRTSEDF